ncbi:MAG: hypothetical protein H0W45_01330 [Acidobacteria bacterium]|nr:hypothetical protein [Acidobacteriota bacterium]
MNIELQSCLPLDLIDPRKKSICCSRSFAGEVKSYTEMAESVINYLSTAAEKMRRQRLTTNAISLFSPKLFDLFSVQKSYKTTKFIVGKKCR